MRIASLGSGSRGNGTLISFGESLVLIDCGFSLKETERRLARHEVSAEQLDAIIVTHEHSDHCSGVGRLSRRYQLPVYMTHGTYVSERCSDVHQYHMVCSERPFSVGELELTPVAVPHDAREPCQFVITAGGRRFGLLTDLGSVTTLVREHFSGLHGLLLEANHDTTLLQSGAYPPALKRRVAGDWGHLNNHQAGQFLGSIDHPQLQQVVIAHISEKNNHPDAVLAALEPHYRRSEELLWANQDEGFGWITLA